MPKQYANAQAETAYVINPILADIKMGLQKKLYGALVQSMKNNRV